MPVNPPYPALQMMVSRRGRFRSSLVDKVCTERRDVRSTCSGWRDIRFFNGASNSLLCLSRYRARRLTVSSLFLESRVVMMRVRHSKAGREDMNSSISRQHIAKPRPLCWLHVSMSIRIPNFASLTCSPRWQAHNCAVHCLGDEGHRSPPLLQEREEKFSENGNRKVRFHPVVASYNSPPLLPANARTLLFKLCALTVRCLSATCLFDHIRQVSSYLLTLVTPFSMVSQREKREQHFF